VIFYNYLFILAIFENITEVRSEVCSDAASQGLLGWILKRLKAKIPFHANKLYASEMLSILLQSNNNNRQLLGELDGIDILLQQLAVRTIYLLRSGIKLIIFNNSCSTIKGMTRHRQKNLK